MEKKKFITNKKRFLVVLGFMFFAVFLVNIRQSAAADCDPNSSLYCNVIPDIKNIAQAGQKIIAYILGLIGFIALLVIIISGLTYITSAGNEQKIESAKKILTSAAIGLVIAVLAYGFLQVIIVVLNM